MLAAVAVLIPTLAYLIGGLLFGTYVGSFGTILAFIGVGAFYVFVIGLGTRLLQALLGPPAIFASLAIFVFLNIASLGATYTAPMLAPFWRFLNHFWIGAGDGQRRASDPLLRRTGSRHGPAQTARLDGGDRRTPRPAGVAQARTQARGRGDHRRSNGMTRNRVEAPRKENGHMATDTHTEPDAREKGLAELRELFADAPEVGKTALESVLSELESQATETPPPPVVSAGRVGGPSGQDLRADDRRPARSGRSRADARVPAPAERQPRTARDKVGSVHDMRFVFLDNDTRMLFATTFDGDWDPYIDDFVDEDPRLPGHHRLGMGGLAGDPQPRGEGLPRQAPGHGRGLVRRQPRPDGGGDAAGSKRRSGQRRSDEFLDKVGD